MRAVGTAVGRNPVGWLIPCHRALRKSGGLGGYHWGLPVKRALLAWEAARAEGAAGSLIRRRLPAKTGACGESALVLRKPARMRDEAGATQHSWERNHHAVYLKPVLVLPLAAVTYPRRLHRHRPAPEHRRRDRRRRRRLLGGLLTGRPAGAAVGAVGGAIVGGAIGQQLDKQAGELRAAFGDDRIGVVNTGSSLVVTMPQDILFATDSASSRRRSGRTCGCSRST